MKRMYQRPTAQVVKLQNQCHLMAGSAGMSGEISGYTKGSGGFSQTSGSRGSSFAEDED